MATRNTDRGLKAQGLDRAGATAVSTPSGLTVLSVLRHLTYVESRWFRHHLLGDTAVSAGDPGGSFAVDPDLSVETAIAAYREACDLSRAAMADVALDTVVAIPNRHFGAVNLRYVLVHMIDETASHLGHLDVAVELAGGPRGESD